MRLFFRTHAEKRRSRRRVAVMFYAVMLSITLLFGASMVLASLARWL